MSAHQNALRDSSSAQPKALNTHKITFLCSDSSDTRDSSPSGKEETAAKTEKNDASFSKESNRFPLTSPECSLWKSCLGSTCAGRVSDEQRSAEVAQTECSCCVGQCRHSKEGGPVHRQDPASKDRGTLICLLNNSHHVCPRQHPQGICKDM